MTEVVVSPEAERDLDEAEAWLVENWGPRPAADLIEAVNAKLALLAEAPLIGAPRPEFGEGVRMILVRPYVIYYDAGQTIVALRILHAARNRNAIMSREREE